MRKQIVITIEDIDNKISIKDLEEISDTIDYTLREEHRVFFATTYGYNQDEEKVEEYPAIKFKVDCFISAGDIPFISEKQL